MGNPVRPAYQECGIDRIVSYVVKRKISVRGVYRCVSIIVWNVATPSGPLKTVEKTGYFRGHRLRQGFSVASLDVGVSKKLGDRVGPCIEKEWTYPCLTASVFSS